MKTATPSPSLALTDLAPTPADFLAEFTAGLRQRPRRLPCKFFYDARGAALFARICRAPEYYPTRTELGILQTHAAAIAAFCGPHTLLVELGSGLSRKTRVLLDALDEPAAYMPIDISRASLEHAARTLARSHPSLEILPVCADYDQPLQLPSPQRAAERTALFFPGSTIGNFEPAAAVEFLLHLGTWCRPDDRLLIGVDFEKPQPILEAAYNDAQGLTAAFNLNLLRRANDELGANFDPGGFSHRALYSALHNRIEMHLVSERAQTVTIHGERFPFHRGERIVTEYSYKYRPTVFARLLERAGWQPMQCWMDPRRWFGVFGCARLCEAGAETD